MPRRILPAVALALLPALGACADAPVCAPTLEAPWIRAAPPGASMLAGYVTVRNDCAVAATIVGAESLDFASVSLHATVEEHGMAHMRAAGPLVVAPGAKLALVPGSVHLMLMGPGRELPDGASARIRLVLADGRRVFAEFPVRREAPR